MYVPCVLLNRLASLFAHTHIHNYVFEKHLLSISTLLDFQIHYPLCKCNVTFSIFICSMCHEQHMYAHVEVHKVVPDHHCLQLWLTVKRGCWHWSGGLKQYLRNWAPVSILVQLIAAQDEKPLTQQSYALKIETGLLYIHLCRVAIKGSCNCQPKVGIQGNYSCVNLLLEFCWF